MLAVVALTACGPGRGTRLGPERHLEVAAGAQGRASTPVAAAAGPLAPGTYYTSLFEPTFTYTVPDGWVLVGETEGGVFLGRDVGSERQAVTLDIFSPVRTDAVVLGDPIKPPDENNADALRRSSPLPDDYIAYLGGLKELTVSAVRPATLLGREGSVADVAVTNTPAGLPCVSPVSCLTLLLEKRPTVTQHGFFVGDHAWVWDLGAGNDRLIVIARSGATVEGSFEQLMQDTLGVLATVRFQ